MKKKRSNEILSDIVKSLSDTNDMIFLLSDQLEQLKIKDWISTGNYLLNAQISGSLFKGIPSGRITMIAGPSGSGKTFLTLNILRNALKSGYNIILIDTESAIDDETLKRFNLDPSSIIYVPLNTVNEATTFLANLWKKLDSYKKEGKDFGKIIIAIDSLGNLSTDKEVSDAIAGSDKVDMTRAREMKKLFRICTQKLNTMSIPIIVTNHVYQNIGSYYIGTGIAGGSGPFYNSSVILELTKSSLKDENKVKTGIIVKSKIVKSRFVKNNVECSFYISYIGGMNPYIGLENYVSWDDCGIDFGKVDSSGNFVPLKNKRFVAVKHLGKSIPFKNMFVPEVFTKEVLECIDSKIKPIFELPQVDNGLDFISSLDVDDEIGDVYE